MGTEQEETLITLFAERTRKEVQASFLEVLQPFFAAHPEIRQIAWEQYTPSFNDGEPCEPTMGDLKFLMADSEEERESYDFKRNSPFCRLYHELRDIKDMLYWLFGDNQRVVVTPTKMTTESYDCGY